MRVNPLKKPVVETIEIDSFDKSISHRCAIFSLLSDKQSCIKNYLKAEDTLNTLNIVSNLGAKVVQDKEMVFITPPKYIKEPSVVLECGNSGTAMRLLMGYLSSQKGFFVLSGDSSLNSRPMNRVKDPLSKIGAKIYGRSSAKFAPICIDGQNLEYFTYYSDISSAQVKTALILAALKGKGCEFSESELSRDHSENMLIKMGASINISKSKILVKSQVEPLKPLNITVPNDPSSAFYFALLACIIPGSNIVLKNILLNKTRIEAYKILKKMGADINFIKTSDDYEPIGDISVRYSKLYGVDVDSNISWLIDEIPALAIAFACANGKSIVRNAKELRVKESDRISTVVKGLRACNINVVEYDDGFSVIGGDAKFATVDSYHDHRIAMSFAILGLKCGMDINDSQYISTSFPNFKLLLEKIGAEIED